jgi:hypothetical protein
MVVQRVDNWNAIYNIAIRYVDKVYIFKTDTLSFKTNLVMVGRRVILDVLNLHDISIWLYIYIVLNTYY